MLRPFLAAFLCLLPASGRAQQSLSFFLTDAALWKLPQAELVARLQPFGYTPVPADGTASLGEPRDLMQRKAEIAPGVQAWKVSLRPGATLGMATVDLLPPANLATPPDKSGFRAAAKRTADFLTKTFGKPGTPWLIDYANPGSRTECTRWIGDSLQVILSTSAVEAGRAFTPERMDLKILPAVAPGSPPNAKPAVAKLDRAAGTVSLIGIPGFNPWPGHPPDWPVFEQALWSLGRTTDRNAVMECALYTSSWPGNFCPAMERVAKASGARTLTLLPPSWTAEESAKILAACTTAGKKLGQPVPAKLEALIDVHPEVLRMARAAPAALTAFSTAVSRALAAGQPVIWVGWRGFYPETPAGPDKPIPAIRLVSGIDTRAATLTFTGENGAAAGTMAVADAMAAAFQVFAVTK